MRPGSEDALLANAHDYVTIGIKAHGSDAKIPKGLYRPNVGDCFLDFSSGGDEHMSYAVLRDVLRGIEELRGDRGDQQIASMMIGAYLPNGRYSRQGSGSMYCKWLTYALYIRTTDN